MTLGLVVALVAIVLALGFGSFRMLTDGRFRRTPDVRASSAQEPAPEASPATAAVGGPLGERATLVQFSSAFCAPCRTTRRVLGQVAETTDGVVHVEIDAEEHLELVRRLDVTRTPTTLILDRSGREVARAAGAPRLEQVVGALPPA